MKKQRATETNIMKRLTLAALATSLLTGGSIAALYLNSPIDTSGSVSQCKGASHSTSADGLVVIGEADLGCLKENQRRQDPKQTKENISNAVLIIGGISLISNVVLIAYLYRKM